jgi:molybdopterin molybdotransferase
VGIVLVKLKGFQKLTQTDQALKSWLKTLQLNKPKITEVPLQEALNRILAQEIIASEDLPRFDKSAVDGYAVKSGDLTGNQSNQQR